MVAKFRVLWDEMDLSHRLIFLSITGAVLVTLLLFFTWLGHEEYSQLFSNLTPEDSARVIELLQKRNLEYKITNGGQGIMVPASRIGEAKVALAGEGLPTGGITGYELFDDQGLGVSEFTQNLNFRRALEGELARSIGTIKGVEKARVHLVMPKQALFKEEQQEPTASVVLTLLRPGLLRRDQVVAIQRLVASSVEGLDGEQVTILDSFGNLLSRDLSNDAAGLSTAQLELKQEVENYLSRKAQGTLESVLGAGTAIVRVNADLDFEKVERTREVVDPDVSVILSEQRSQSVRESDGESNESSTVNYEFNRMVENIIGASGSLERLSVAVLIDGTYAQTEGEQESQYVARSPQELEGYRKIVENIVGLDSARGDRIEVLNVRFSEPLLPSGKGLGGGWLERAPSLVNKLLIVAAIVFLLLTFRKLGGQLMSNLGPPPGAETRPQAGGQAGRTAGTVSRDMSALGGKSGQGAPIELEDQARAIAIEKPEDVAQLVRSWMQSKS